MKVKTLLVKISLCNNLRATDIELRHILVDTIENRGLGEVVEETSSEKQFELVIEHPTIRRNVVEKLKNLLNVLGFTNYQMKYIIIPSEK